MEKLIAKARELTDTQIAEALDLIGGGFVETDTRMVRAALIEVVVERHGSDFADEVMDRLGL